MISRQRILDDLKAAMKSGDRDRLGVLRMIKARIQEAEVKMRSGAGRDAEVDEAGLMDVLSTLAKQRRESIDGYRKGGREELAVQEERELEIVMSYLPDQMSEDEVREAARQAVADTGASSARDMGAVMGRLVPQVKGRADGKLVSRIVRELLTG